MASITMVRGEIIECNYADEISYVANMLSKSYDTPHLYISSNQVTLWRRRPFVRLCIQEVEFAY